MTSDSTSEAREPAASTSHQRETLLRRLSVAFIILLGIGALTAIVFTIISGVQYRMQEEQGLQPGYAPGWIVLGTYTGVWLFLLGVAALAVTGVVALAAVRHRRMTEVRAVRAGTAHQERGHEPLTGSSAAPGRGPTSADRKRE